MPDYSKGDIYQIKNYIDDDIYVGSTCDALGRHMTKHRYDAKHHVDVSLYHKVKEHGAEHFYIAFIEACPCNSKQDLLAREGHVIRERGTTNKRIAGRDGHQYQQEHTEEQAIHNHERYEQNKEPYRETTRQWNDNNT